MDNFVGPGPRRRPRRRRVRQPLSPIRQPLSPIRRQPPAQQIRPVKTPAVLRLRKRPGERYAAPPPPLFAADSLASEWAVPTNHAAPAVPDQQALVEDWQRSFATESKEYESVYLYATMRFGEVLKRSSDHKGPSAARAAVCVDLLRRVGALFGRFGGLVDSIADELAKVLYVDGPQAAGADANTMFQMETWFEHASRLAEEDKAAQARTLEEQRAVAILRSGCTKFAAAASLSRFVVFATFSVWAERARTTRSKVAAFRKKALARSSWSLWRKGHKAARRERRQAEQERAFDATQFMDGMFESSSVSAPPTALPAASPPGKTARLMAAAALLRNTALRSPAKAAKVSTSEACCQTDDAPAEDETPRPGSAAPAAKKHHRKRRKSGHHGGASGKPAKEGMGMPLDACLDLIPHIYDALVGRRDDPEQDRTVSSLATVTKRAVRSLPAAHRCRSASTVLVRCLS